MALALAPYRAVPAGPKPNVTTSRSNQLIGRRARFRIRDVHYPEPAVVLEQLHGGDVLQGEVMDLSASGLQEAAYAVIRVDRLREPLIVAVDRLLGCD